MAENENANALAIKYNREYLVVQANELVRSKQDDLTLLEAKLVRLAISQVLAVVRDKSFLTTYIPYPLGKNNIACKPFKKDCGLNLKS